jgi:hypothetical protein
MQNMNNYIILLCCFLVVWDNNCTFLKYLLDIDVLRVCSHMRLTRLFKNLLFFIQYISLDDMLEFAFVITCILMYLVC